MSDPLTTPKLMAGVVSRLREVFATSLDTAGLRELGMDVLDRSVFSARAVNVIYASKIKEVVDALAAGETDFATARWILRKTLNELGYTPEGGFPDTPPGEVPPALAGTLQDLSSTRRLELILTTQRDIARGKGQQLRGHERARLFPAWELVRVKSVRVPRDWPSRWVIAGGTFYDQRMIALKGDPVWGELGSYGNFQDALGVDYPPFAFNSGMGWREVSQANVGRLKITGPNGESPDEWLASQPVTLSGKMPPPLIDVNETDPKLLDALSKIHGVTVVDGKMMQPEDKARVLADIEQRRIEREARRAERLKQSIAKRIEEYNAR